MEDPNGTTDPTETHIRQAVDQLRQTIEACDQVQAEALLLRKAVELDEVATTVAKKTLNPIVRLVAELARDTGRSVADILLATLKPADEIPRTTHQDLPQRPGSPGRY